MYTNNPIRTKIVTDNQILQKMYYINFLLCDLAYESDINWNDKLAEFKIVCRRLKNKREYESMKAYSYKALENVGKRLAYM